jgi:hypothetical protein
MWLKAYKSIGKLFDYGIMGQPLKYGVCDFKTKEENVYHKKNKK